MNYKLTNYGRSFIMTVGIIVVISIHSCLIVLQLNKIDSNLHDGKYKCQCQPRETE